MGALAFVMTLIVLTGAGLVQALALGSIARSVPLAAGAWTLVLLTAQLVAEARQWSMAVPRKERGEQAMDSATTRRVAVHVGGLLSAVLFLGLTMGIPIYTFLAQARAGSIAIAAITACVFGAGCLAADTLLGGLYPGILWTLLGRGPLG